MTKTSELIPTIEEHRNSIEPKSRDGFYDSIVSIISICERYYNKESVFHKELSRIQGQLGIMKMTNSPTGMLGVTLDDLKDSYKNVLDSMVSEISTVGLPPKNDNKIDNSIRLSVSQSQHQSIEVSFITDALNDELSGKQIRELREIIESEKDKSKVLEKIKSFGLDVTSGILSSILSNPSIWS